MEANREGNLAQSADEKAVAFVAKSILDRYQEVPLSDDELDERSDAEESQSENEPEVICESLLEGRTFALIPLDAHGPDDNTSQIPPQKRARTHDESATSRFWFPWPDRITCTLDILMHLPRSVFSHRQLDLFLWLLKVNNVDDVPSVKQMQKINLALQKVCGIDSIPYNGALGHKYFVNSLAQIIAQEMANPRVRPHLSFYPEDSGSRLSEARQGDRWLKEIPDEQTTPMLRILGHDYYIYEPAMLDDSECCIPTRWFIRGGKYFAKCWKMLAVTSEMGSGWRILQTDDYEIPASRFLKNFIQFQVDARLYDVPHPSFIIDVIDPVTRESKPWAYTNPVIGNRWRAKANGSRVVAFPMWMYCDDTSGNGKWNEHNSFLMTPAGLPREQSQKEYNIHFLCTSNLARPLEMLDGIVEQLEEAQGDGIWVWDVEFNEPVLVIPEVLALLGDNPMQSEFACHIGLAGKFFCRACWVKGTDALDDDDEGVAGSDTSAASGLKGTSKKGKGKKVKETMVQMVTRVKAFMKIGTLRKKEDTTEKLRSFFTQASTKLDTKTKVKEMRTETGLKDKFQMVFIDKLFNSYKGKRGAANKRAALEAKVAAMPVNTMSPVWRIRGLDPHQDTPVEILHVVLLGFVKYLWRDLVQLQLNKKDAKKELLATRLSSLDVSGLGISPLAGKTLVQYSGSLTGRDFRVIAQVAPFVVYDLVSKECLETWQALSKMVPLIWQPEIKDIESHIILLTKEIDNFLLCAARWTNRWFNKPKFHIFLHLPAHIRRFGPAILFATESFESFNAIIRAKSVHSNCHAPSRDIAQAFAQGNRIRHLLSGGLFLFDNESDMSNSPEKQTQGSRFSADKTAWRTIGAGPAMLVSAPNTVTHYLGLDKKKLPAAGVSVTADDSMPLPIIRTLAGKYIPGWAAKEGRFRLQKQLYLHNGDSCRPGNFVIVQHPLHAGETFVARVEEIIQQVGSVASFSSQPDGIVLQKVTVDRTLQRYGMPSVKLSGQWSMHCAKDILCTVNVQHNWVDNDCDTTGSFPVYQERTRTTQTLARVAHKGNLDDMVLNTAQMRDAIHVQPFRIHPTLPDLDTVVHQSAAKEIGARKARAAAAAEASNLPPVRAIPVASGSALPNRLSALQATTASSTSSTAVTPAASPPGAPSASPSGIKIRIPSVARLAELRPARPSAAP
ncbi:hypothetical protein C8R43DRAFT_898835 [Mycena crocata]|nr:hypothetical protein C8R43DRAFT_898835 [Mycena crocata]